MADYFLKINGIPGESQNPRHQGEIEVESFSWSESYLASAGGTGKVHVQDLQAQRGIVREPLLHQPHRAGPLKPADRGHRARARQVVQRRERGAIRQPWRGLDHVRQPARAAVRHPAEGPGRAAQLPLDHRLVGHRRDPPAAGPAGLPSACCTECHSRSYQGVPPARAAAAEPDPGPPMIT